MRARFRSTFSARKRCLAKGFFGEILEEEVNVLFVALNLLHASADREMPTNNIYGTKIFWQSLFRRTELHYATLFTLMQLA